MENITDVNVSISIDDDIELHIRTYGKIKILKKSIYLQYGQNFIKDHTKTCFSLIIILFVEI